MAHPGESAPVALRFLSWNLALLERSDQAPHTWEVHDTEAAVRRIVLEHDPDIVVYQELPGLVPFVETLDMVRANPRSHSGHLATLARPTLLDPAPTVTVVPGALLTTFAAPAVTVANVHLAPGAGAAAQRLAQLAAVVEASPTAALLIVGDTNTRVDEMAALGEAGLTAPVPPHPTWDSRRNRFRADGPRFSAFFTRCFAGPDVEVSALEVHRTPERSGDHRFFLSDHFSLTGTVALR